MHDGARAEKGADFHEGMEHQMGQRPRQSKGGHDHRSEQDIGEVAYGGVSQPSFKVRFLYRPTAAVNDGKHDHNHDYGLRPCTPQKIRAEAVVGKTQDGKGAGFYHSHCVEQCGDRRGSHAGLGEPGV